MSNHTPTTLPNGRDFSDPIVFALAYEAAEGKTFEDYLAKYKREPLTAADADVPAYQNLPHDPAQRAAFLARRANVAAGVEGLS